MGLFDRSKATVGSLNSCNYCGTTFESLKAGVYLGNMDVGDTILRMRKGCDNCGVPVCFDCAASAADTRGQKGHCICPKCGVNLD
jgi:hypothetical protein